MRSIQGWFEQLAGSKDTAIICFLFPGEGGIKYQEFTATILKAEVDYMHVSIQGLGHYREIFLPYLAIQYFRQT